MKPGWVQLVAPKFEKKIKSSDHGVKAKCKWITQKKDKVFIICERHAIINPETINRVKWISATI